MQDLIVALTGAVEGSPAVALVAAAAWGVLSMVLSPCHLAGIPLIIGFIGDQGRPTPRRSCALASAFAGGILITIAVIGAITASLGRILGDIGSLADYLMAGVFFLVGLHLLDVIPLPFSGAGADKVSRRGVLAALVLGLLFGIALGPCSFAFIAPMLAVTFRVASTDVLYAIGLLLAYGVGHCAVIVAAGTCTGAVQRFLSWNGRFGGATLLRRVCGVLILFGGLYLIYRA